jgi:hypothetical protein
MRSRDPLSLASSLREVLATSGALLQGRPLRGPRRRVHHAGFMTDSPLSQDLTDFIRSTLPTLQAAELLIVVARDPTRAWTPQALMESMPSSTLTREAASEFLRHFARAGLVRDQGDETFRFDPASEELRGVVAMLADAYDHRPVTLIRVIDSMSTARIQSFADAFRLKRDS